MSALADILDDLMPLEARLRAAKDAVAPLRAKATQMAIEENRVTGANRWVRFGLGTVTLCKPDPRSRITNRQALVDWLNANGYGDLVTTVVTVKDAQGLAQLMRSKSNYEGWEVIEALHQFVDWEDQEVRDVWEQLWATNRFVAVGQAVQRLSTSDGEIVPGLERVQPEPDRVRVVVDRALRERAGVDLLLDEADAEADDGDAA